MSLVPSLRHRLAQIAEEPDRHHRWHDILSTAFFLAGMAMVAAALLVLNLTGGLAS